MRTLRNDKELLETITDEKNKEIEGLLVQCRQSEEELDAAYSSWGYRVGNLNLRLLSFLRQF